MKNKWQIHDHPFDIYAKMNSINGFRDDVSSIYENPLIFFNIFGEISDGGRSIWIVR